MFRFGVKFLGITVLLLAGGAYLILGKAESSSNQRQSSQLTPEDQILQATVRILLFSPAIDQEGNAGRYTFATGLGTRVKDGSRSLIVTHDHWGEALKQAAFVHFYGSDNRLLVELNGDAFRNLVLYRDQGTMILRAPQAVPGVARLGDPRQINVGDKVALIHQETGRRPETALVQVKQAVVQDQADFKGLDSNTFVSADGQPTVHGDSGGGIWHNGRLVGNMWATKTGVNWQVWTWDSLEEAIVETDRSIGAAYPVIESELQTELDQVYQLQQIVIGIDG